MREAREREELERLRVLLERAEAPWERRLRFDELRELARLYRRASARLARLREREDDPEATRHLNALCLRAYAHLASVAGTPRTGREPRRSDALARALARTGWAQALAWALLVAGVYVGAALGAADPRAVHALIPGGLGYEPEQLDRLVASADARAEFLTWESTPWTHNAVFGSSLFAHNTRVGLLAFATGILGGVPTLLLAVYNGLTLGAFGWIFLRPPWQAEFLAWILPHGVPELTAVCLCVAAGLLLGRAVAAPGAVGRRAALRNAGESALLLFGVSLPLFGVAAGVESFVRESALATAPRLALAAFFLVVLAAGALATRRAARRHGGDASWLAGLGRPIPPASPPQPSAP